jgi:hypothetical protein
VCDKKRRHCRSDDGVEIASVIVIETECGIGVIAALRVL